MEFLGRKTYVVPIGAAAAVIFFLALWLIPVYQSKLYRDRFSPEDIRQLEPKERMQFEKSVADIENSARVTLAQIIGGLALLSGLYFTFRNAKTAQENIKLMQENLRITEEGKITERFSKAVELLGSDELELRLGGIYALERIARDSQKDHWTVMEVLTAFVRANSHKKLEQPELAEQKSEKPREDIQAVLTLIGNREWVETEENKKLNLHAVNLANYNLKGLNFNKANFSEANLNGANLTKTKLKKTSLNYANLSFSVLIGAELEGAFLVAANLEKADLFQADLTAAIVTSEQILIAKNFETADLPLQVDRKLNEWQAKQAKETNAGVDSSENQAGE